jgi:hypothetical protein
MHHLCAEERRRREQKAAAIGAAVQRKNMRLAAGKTASLKDGMPCLTYIQKEMMMKLPRVKVLRPAEYLEV